MSGNDYERHRGIGRLLKLSLSILLLLSLPVAVLGARRDAVESEPDLRTSKLLGTRVAMQGKGYQLPDRVPVRDFMARFRVDTDVGMVEAVGTDEAVERLAELPAARRLQAMRQSDVFRRAFVESAKSTGEAIARVVSQPAETLAALPAGIGRALVSVGRRARNVATTIGDTVRRTDEGESAQAASSVEQAPSEQVIDFGKEAAGVNKARRAIARDLGIDPYTRNPLLAARLEELAWASVAGGVSVDILLGTALGGARGALDVADQLDQLAWEAPPADIRRALEKQLQARGHGGFEAREFLRNAAFSPSDQLRLVAALETIGTPDGEASVLAHASRISHPRHARFLLRQLQMLAVHDQGAYLSKLVVTDELLSAVTTGGKAILPLPVDQLSWTESLATASTISKQSHASGGTILLTGIVTPMARKNLAAMGWSVTLQPTSPSFQ